MSLFNFLKTRLSILEIVQEYCQLKQAGHYFKGTCPFHNETDASFTVSPDKGIFYCFGCQAGGDVIAFIAKKENLSQHEAAQHLIDRYSIEVPEELSHISPKEARKAKEKKLSHFHVCEVIATWTHEQLASNRVASDYLTARGITKDMIDYFQMGYFPGGLAAMNRLLKEMTHRHILLKDLMAASVAMQGQSHVYSPFEERIMFPIRDGLGRYVGFGGRIFKPGDKRPKYYNSKESDFFAKGHLIFGLDLAKKAMQDKGQAFLVEGYTDCLAMVQGGYTNTVATLGTACTLEHLKILSRHISQLYVLYDGDAAGQKAILRLAEMCWEVNLELQIIRLPSTEDPASFLQKKGDLNDLIGKSRDIFTFFVDTLGRSFHSQPLSGKLAVSQKIIEVIARVKDHLKQDMLLQQAASVMHIPLETFKERLLEHKSSPSFSTRASTSTHASAQKPPVTPDSDGALADMPGLEKKILFAIINNVEKAVVYSVGTDLLPYFSTETRHFLDKVTKIAEDNESGTRFNAFFEGLPPAEQQWVSAQSLADGQPITDEIWEQLLFQFRKNKWKEIVKNFKGNLLSAQQTGNTERFNELMVTFAGLKQEMRDKGFV